MDVIFHIGLSKTGSTAMQRTFCRSVDYLLSKGVLYPRNPKFPKSENHRLYATQIAPFEELPRHMRVYGGREQALAHFAELHAHIRSEVTARRPALLLLSSETMAFSPIRMGFRETLAARLGELGPTPRFVVYMRRPSDHYVSQLQQKLRASATFLQPKPPSYRKLLGSYLKLFGKRSVAAHPFSRAALHEGDVVADFAARYLASYGVGFEGLTKVGEANVGVSAESMRVLQAFRRRFHPGQDDVANAESDRLRKMLRDADAAVGAGKPRLRQEVAEIVDYGAADPLWLRDQCGITFPDFDYTWLEAGRFASPPPRPLALEEIVTVDPAKQEAILDHIRETWAARRPSRRRWLEELRRELTATA